MQEKKPKSRRGEEGKNETDDNSASSISSMMLDEDLMLGPETAFLAEGSVHDTGGMVEWAGTVGKDVGIDDEGDKKIIQVNSIFRIETTKPVYIWCVW